MRFLRIKSKIFETFPHKIESTERGLIFFWTIVNVRDIEIGYLCIS